MASNMHVAIFFLAFLLPRSCLLGIVIASCILMLLVPLRVLWYNSSRLQSRRKYSIRLSKEQKRRIRQRHQRAVWMRDRRERQRLYRDIWKLTHRLCVSMHEDTSADGSDGYEEIKDPVQKASTPRAKFANGATCARHLSACKQHPKIQAFARYSDGDAASCSEVHGATAHEYSTPCVHSIPVYTDNKMISHEACMPCAQGTQGFANGIAGDAVAHNSDAIIIPGSSNFHFLIVSYVMSFSFGFENIHLQAAIPAEFLEVSGSYPIYMCLRFMNVIFSIL